MKVSADYAMVVTYRGESYMGNDTSQLVIDPAAVRRTAQRAEAPAGLNPAVHTLEGVDPAEAFLLEMTPEGDRRWLLFIRRDVVEPSLALCSYYSPGSELPGCLRHN